MAAESILTAYNVYNLPDGINTKPIPRAAWEAQYIDRLTKEPWVDVLDSEILDARAFAEWEIKAELDAQARADRRP